MNYFFKTKKHPLRWCVNINNFFVLFFVVLYFTFLYFTFLYFTFLYFTLCRCCYIMYTSCYIVLTSLSQTNPLYLQGLTAVCTYIIPCKYPPIFISKAVLTSYKFISPYFFVFIFFTNSSKFIDFLCPVMLL